MILRRSPPPPLFSTSQNPRASAWGFCYNTHSVRVRNLKTTTFHWICGRATTHLSGCVVVLLFISAPVVGVKLGGDAAAHPVFCLSSFFLPCHVYALVAHTPLAAHNAQYAKPLQAGVHLHFRLGFAASCVLGNRWRTSNVRSLSRIISRRRLR